MRRRRTDRRIPGNANFGINSIHQKALQYAQAKSNYDFLNTPVTAAKDVLTVLELVPGAEVEGEFGDAGITLLTDNLLKAPDLPTTSLRSRPLRWP